MGAERSEDRAQSAIEGLIGGPDESLFRAHFENSPGPAYIWRRHGDDFVLIAHNKAAEERVRRWPNELHIGASAKALLGRSRQDLLAQAHQCVDNGEVIRYECEFCYSSGEVRRLAFTMVPIGADSFVQHTDDITERYAAEQALRASEARAWALMAANPDMLTRVSRDGMYLDVHIPEKISVRLPFRREQFLGRNVADLFDAEFARGHERYRQKAIDTGIMQTWQYTRPVEGKIRYVEARFVRSGEDEVVISVTDVTDRVDLEREVVNSVERERNHIGHDLHDGLGQLLTGAKLMLEPLRKKLTADRSPDGRNLQQAIDLINQAIGQTSELARGLSPVPREAGLTLNDALAQLAMRSQKLFGITCRLADSDATGELTEECANNLYRIAQEAITNAVKHGRATEIEIGCRVDAGRLTMAIEDNGIGIGESKPKSGGMGMQIMQYRARAFGGEIAASSRPGGGTVIACVCPLPIR